MGRKTKAQIKLEARQLAKKEMELDLAKYKNTDELLGDYLLEAVKRWILEMNFGEKSQDRIKAAQHIVYQLQGKPVEKILNLTAKVGDLTDNELRKEIEDKLAILGYTKGKRTSTSLIVDSGSGIKPDKAAKIRAKSRVSNEIPEILKED